MTEILDILRTPYGDAATLALLHFVWQGTLLAGMAALILPVLRHASPASRYIAACGLLLAMFVAPVATWIVLLRGPSSESLAGIPALPKVFSTPAAVALDGSSEPTATPLVLMVWLAGVLVFSLRAVGGWAAACWRLHSGRRPVDPAVGMCVQAVAKRIGVARAVRAFESARVRVPSVFGFIRPAIVLPATAITGLTPAQLVRIHYAPFRR